MPELPEVETITKDLQTKVLNRTFVDVWTDTKKIIKKNFPQFKKIIKNSKIKKIERRGKNIIILLSNNYYLLIHLKMTGHLIYDHKDNWQKKEGPWKDKYNQYLRVIFFLDKERILALSDLRKFAKIELFTKEELKNNLKKLGPEPLDISFKEFEKALPKKGKIKTILLNQEIITGIGNIYADEILWEAKIHPLTDISKVNKKILYQKIKKILKKEIKLIGSSVSDYRDLQGKKGFYAEKRKAYKKTFCFNCKKKIKRIKINNRGTYFCPYCQKL